MHRRSSPLRAARRLFAAVLAFALVGYGAAAAAPPHVDDPHFVHTIPAEIVAPAPEPAHAHDAGAKHMQPSASGARKDAPHHHGSRQHDKSTLIHVHAVSAFVAADTAAADVPLPHAAAIRVAMAPDASVIPQPSSPPLRPPRIAL